MTYLEIMNNHDIRRSNSDLKIDAKLIDTESDAEKNLFEDLTRRYFVMLVFGCGDDNCNFKLCRSCKTSRKVDRKTASVLSVSLASKPRLMLCPNVRTMHKEAIECHIKKNQPESNAESSSNTIYSSFLSRMISFTSLSHIFDPNPQPMSVQGKKLKEEQMIENNRPYQFNFSQNIKSIFEGMSQQEKSKKANSLNDARISNSTKIPAYLNSTVLEKLSAEYKVSGNSQIFIDTLTTIYSSRNRLGRSFLVNPDLKSSELDLDDLERFHRIIPHEQKDIFDNTITHSTSILLEKLNNMDILNDHSHVRALLINPQLSNNEIFVRKLSYLADKFSEHAKKIFLIWISRFPELKFKTIVDAFKLFIASHYYPGPQNDQAVVSGLKFMKVIFEANQMTRIINIAEFYIPDISQTLNFKQEIKNWRSSTKFGKFSFFNYPFLFDPIAKSRIMHLDALYQMSSEFEDAYVSQALVYNAQKFLENHQPLTELEDKMKTAANPFLVLEIRRETMIEDTIEQLRKKTQDLKKAIRITFVDGGEIGLDQGGVQKEFFQLILSKLLDVQYGLFVYDDQSRYHWINSDSRNSHIYYELVGVLIGLAIYNGVMLGITFPPIFYKKILDERIEFSDFIISFPQLGKGLEQLLTWSDGDVEDIFQRSFEISYQHRGALLSKPLIPDGANIPVTNENRHEFVDRYMDYYVNESTRDQFRSMKKGLLKIYGEDSLRLCHSSELEMIICGLNSSAYNFQDLKDIAKYDDGYNLNHRNMIWFWEIVDSFTIVHKKKLLTFVTSSDRIPLNGLKSLTFVIQRNGPDSDRLPTALTCFGRLLLPEYDTKEKLEKLLIVAIENAAGFGLI